MPFVTIGQFKKKIKKNGQFCLSARFGKNLPRSNHVGKNKAKKRLENAYLGEIEPVQAVFEQIENNAPSRNKSWLNVTRIFIDFSKKIRIGSVSLIFPRRYNKKREHMLPTIKNAKILCFQDTEDFRKVQGW